ncbi:MAG: hypothetical protein QOI54_2847 [Actinomycetota bacterium]|jgi:hypothetical protein|nr:hypothetical protein [Actinomycetota bacterium]
MHHKSKLLGALAIAGVIATAGSAFTASNEVPTPSVVKGYGSQTITGVTASAITYNTNAAGDTITSVGLTLATDTTGKTIQVAFNDAAPATCSDAGTYDATSQTTYTCAVNQPVGGATKFALVAN